MNVFEIQEALLAKGFKPGPVDGVLGKLTLSAIKAFQRSVGIDDDGIVGPITSKALLGNAWAYPQWMAEAKRYLGLHEVRDAAKLDELLNLDASEIPWCGAFVAMVISTTLPDEPIPANPLWARNWVNFGVVSSPINGNPYFGDVAVFTRKSGGHVGFVVGHDENYVHVLGGNQSNAVTVTKVAKSQLLGYRRPRSVKVTGSRLGYSKFTGSVFNNEG